MPVYVLDVNPTGAEAIHLDAQHDGTGLTVTDEYSEVMVVLSHTQLEQLVGMGLRILTDAGALCGGCHIRMESVRPGSSPGLCATCSPR